MNVVFVSNYFNHHQKYLSDELNSILGEGNYFFLKTEDMPEERKRLGYPALTASYLRKYSASGNNREECAALIRDADILLFGDCSEHLIQERRKAGKLILRCSERPLKKGLEPLKFLGRAIRFRVRSSRNTYMLCIGAYAAKDWRKMGLYRNKTFTWGYFPEVETLDVDKIIAARSSIRGLICGRMLSWKHFDDAIRAVKLVSDRGYSFSLDVIGRGEEEEHLRALVRELHVEDKVSFLGEMPPKQVRETMKKHDIYLFPSDQQEGWGVVANEAMNSACCVIAGDQAGSAKVLIRDGVNGLLFSSGNADALADKIILALKDEKLLRSIQKEAYQTIQDTWCPAVAAKRLVQVCEGLLSGKVQYFDNGPLSKAE